jgi:pSer/pThr/pTyr-binding forkhead associated (FHA) protein
VADTWLISDLGSMNGTRVNGWRLTGPAPLRPGDQVGFGNLTFLVAAPR